MWCYNFAVCSNRSYNICCTRWISALTSVQANSDFCILLRHVLCVVIIHHKCTWNFKIMKIFNEFVLTNSLTFIPCSSSKGRNVSVAAVRLVCSFNIRHFSLFVWSYYRWMDLRSEEFYPRYWIYAWCSRWTMVAYLLEIYYTRHFDRTISIYIQFIQIFD